MPRPCRGRGARGRRLRDRRALGGCRAGCDPGLRPASLTLVSDGTLTIGADNPAFPPWFGGAEKTKPWKVSDPYSGKGYESAVAYAVAKELGFTKAQVKWTVVPFSNSFRPGKKSFDFYLTQVSFSPERARAVDFSMSYYYVNQSVVGRKGKPIAKVRSIAGLKPYKLGAQVGTTSYTYITRFMRPSSSPLVYDTNDAAVQALKNGQLDGIVVDLPTAFYVTAVQVDDGVIVGKLPTRGTKERFGMVFQKGNTLRRCVDRALARLWRAGTIKKLQTTYLARAGAPDLKYGRSSRILGGLTARGTSESRAVVIAVASTIVVAAAIVVVVTRSPGWDEFKAYFFNWGYYRESFPEILDAFWVNVKLFCIAEAIILPAALLLAVLRSLPGPVFFPIRALAIVYADLFRGIPTILVIFMLGFGMPALGLEGVPSSQFFWAVVALTLVYTAYVSEVYRAGIESVHPSQAAAARSLGLTHGQSLRHVVLPQAVRRVIPPLLNDFIGLQKDTALVGALGVVEAFRQTQINQAATFNGTYYLVAATLFVAITIPLARFTDWLVARDRRRQQAGRLA